MVGRQREFHLLKRKRSCSFLLKVMLGDSEGKRAKEMVDEDKRFIPKREVLEMNSGWIRYWYAPAVKWWIKREVEMSSYWARDDRLQNAILYYFKLTSPKD